MFQRVLAIGVFDLFHVGHLRYLQYARSHGSYLIVAVSADEVVMATKGKTPVISQDQRLEIIASLGWVDLAKLLPNSTEDTEFAASWIAALKVDCVVVGGEWQNSERWRRLKMALMPRGISVVFAPHTQGISSSNIIKKILQQNIAEIHIKT